MEAFDVLQNTFKHARSSIDKVPSWVLQSRIFTLAGDTMAAFQALKLCLRSLGLDFDLDLSWEQCDEQFHTLRARIMSTDRTELLDKSASQERNVIAMGGTLGNLSGVLHHCSLTRTAVIVEIVSSAFWTNALVFYQLVLRFVDIHWTLGAFAQVGLGYMYLAG